jgi:threonine/homoserine efflux transporter RhtA
MKIQRALRHFLAENILTQSEHNTLQAAETQRPISIHWEVRILLLAGISLLTTGLGILVYKNIDTIGHQAIIAAIAVTICACSWYVYKKRQLFTWQNKQADHATADNLLLLACSLFLILEGYVQYQYNLFGTQYGLATLIPTVLFFFCAYRFDHIGVLTMALTAFVSWAGIAVTPLSIFQENVFNQEPTLIHTGILVGILMCATGLALQFRHIKPHFTFSYLSFGFNLACIATIYGAFNISETPYCLLCLAFCILAFLYARREKSYFFLLSSVIYAYIAFTILIFQVRLGTSFGLWYGVASCLAIVVFLANYKKILK